MHEEITNFADTIGKQVKNFQTTFELLILCVTANVINDFLIWEVMSLG